MFWRAIKNSKLLRAPELVLPFCIRLAPQKISGPREQEPCDIGGDHPAAARAKSCAAQDGPRSE